MSILLFENDILFFEHFEHFESIFDYLSILFISFENKLLIKFEKLKKQLKRMLVSRTFIP